MLLVYKSRTKSFCSILYISTFKNFQKEKKKMVQRTTLE